MTLILTHDIGTTSNKTCLYRIDDRVTLLESVLVDYPLYTMPDGGVEQDADDWWTAVTQATNIILKRTAINPTTIKGMAFCAQMQCFIPVDQAGTPLHRPMNYLDSRSTAQIDKYLYHGFPRIEGWNAYKTLRSLHITGGLATTAKDPLWKYHWFKDNEPHLFKQMYKWLDVRDYLVQRATGEFSMSLDSAHLTFLYDTRPGKLGWNEGLCRLFDVNMAHLAPVKASTDVIGQLTPQAAAELGLEVGTPVFGGGGDASLIAIGSGAFDLNDTHIYIGTSGWVATAVDKRKTDISGLIAAILGAIPGWYNYIAELETAGRSLQWVRDHLALDEIGVYLADHPYSDNVDKLENMFEFMNQEIAKVPPGANGVIFTPWLHGNRSPFEDPYARGLFFNLGLETGKREMIRAVLEGVAFHMRWMLERIEKNVPYRDRLRFVGGGAQSDEWAQILADVTGRQIEVIENAQNAGTVGAAIVCGVGLGVIKSFQAARPYIRIANTFTPQPENRAVYDRNFNVFTQLYKQNRKLFKQLNST